MTAAPVVEIGQNILGHYRLVSPLAEGGQGVVYLARNEGAAGFVKPVVVKFLLPHLHGDDDRIDEFTREAHVLAHLRHPNIVSILDFGLHDETYAMILDFVEGYSLDAWYRFMRATGGRFPVQYAVYVMGCVLDALHYAHTSKGPDGESLQIVHRDVAPKNILIDLMGHVKLTDFGIAHMVTEYEELHDPNVVKGTMGYIAPEIWRGYQPTPQSDIYACGMMLYEVVGGQSLPVPSKTDLNEAIRISKEWMPKRLDSLRTDVPTGLADIVEKALAKEPLLRYQTAKDFVDELRLLRTIEEREAQTAIAEQVGRDFKDKRMRTIAAMGSLATMERAWRRGGYPHGGDSGPAHLAHGRVDHRQRRVQRWLIYGAATLAMLAGLFSLVFALAFDERPSSSAEPTFIVVESPAASAATGGASSSAAPAPPDRQSSPDEVERVSANAPKVRKNTRPRGKRRRKRARAAAPEDALTAAFARQQRRVAACFRKHTAIAAAPPRLAVRFHISEAGVVQRAELLPPEVAGVPLGKCLLAVARRTRFTRQPAPISFRIPIVARAQ